MVTNEAIIVAMIALPSIAVRVWRLITDAPILPHI